jgi:hypothetical protein
MEGIIMSRITQDIRAQIVKLAIEQAFKSRKEAMVEREAALDSTSVTSPCHARIFWKFSGLSSRLVDVARALFQIAPVTRD